jgi:hypothetical protein
VRIHHDDAEDAAAADCRIGDRGGDHRQGQLDRPLCGGAVRKGAACAAAELAVRARGVDDEGGAYKVEKRALLSRERARTRFCEIRGTWANIKGNRF